MNLLNQLSIRAKLYGATLGAMLVIAVLSGTAWYGNRQASVVLHEIVERNLNPLMALTEVDDLMSEVRFRIAGVILDQMPAPGSRQHAKDVQEKIPKLWAVVSSGIEGPGLTDEEKELMVKLNKSIGELPAFLAKIQRAYESADDKKELSVILEEEWPSITTTVSKPLDKLIQIRSKRAISEQNSAYVSGEKLNRLVMFVSFAAFVLLVMGAILVVRSIAVSVDAFGRAMTEVGKGDLTARAAVSGRDELAQMGSLLNHTMTELSSAMNEVLRSSNDISTAARQLSSNAAVARDSSDAQTDEIMKISAGMEQLTVSISEVSSGAARVLEAAADAKRQAEGARKLMGDTRDASSRALLATAASTNVVGELSGSVQRITEITAVIKEIADQTNLLALNAAIEAARAGESGRGFAVVADEVRKLAERTARSTADIGMMVTTIQGKTGAAVEAMDRVDADVKEGAVNIEKLGESLQKIVASATEVTRQADEISGAMREQKTVAEQTAQSMEAISQRVEHTSGAVTEVSTTAAQAAAIAQVLEASVRRFKV
jgi:methyl-accepting chemotaxis protein